MATRPVVLGSFLLALLAVGGGCSSSTTTPTLSSESDVTRGVMPGLEQRVILSPAELVSGENVEIHSVITNRGTQAVTLQSRICGLDVESDAALPHPPGIGFCGGHSMGGTIEPGEARESTDIRRVASAAGSYTLRVRHALQPALWVEMRVVVRAR